MPQFSVSIKGADRVRVGLNKFINTLPIVTKKMIKGVMDRAMKASIPYLGGANYAIPVRSYRRTGNLGRSTWVENANLTYTIKTNAVDDRGRAYSRYVVGGADGTGQASVHNGYWTRMRVAVDAELALALPDIDDTIQGSGEAMGL